MAKITEKEITKYVEALIPDFHKRRLESLKSLKLRNILKRKNPYLFKAKNVTSAPELVLGILEAHLSSQEETLFGDILEQLAVFVCEKVYGGMKIGAIGRDLQFEKNNVVYLISIKSGPNWGNSSQIDKMLDKFRSAKRVLSQNNKRKQIEMVNGCCYGRSTKEDKGEYLKICGQKFWSLISGIDTLYTDIIEPFAHKAKERNDEFQVEYGKVRTVFTKEFIYQFCKEDGTMLWQRLVKFNSSSNPDDWKLPRVPKSL
jgi:hypothetical protein